jgi:hypothetical protein
MPHLVLIGDSIFDNGAYTRGGPEVIQQVQEAIPPGWQADLRAVDGATTEGVDAQLARLPSGVTHLVLSVGGNNALQHTNLLQRRVTSSSETLLQLHQAVSTFERSYRRMIGSCLSIGVPLVVCTIYHGNFPDPAYQACAAVALTVFNDVIIRVACEKDLTVIDLRMICTEAADYANPIEPSSTGGRKIAAAIVRAVAQPGTLRGARIVGL